MGIAIPVQRYGFRGRMEAVFCPGSIGQRVVRGRHVMKGYLNKPNDQHVWAGTVS